MCWWSYRIRKNDPVEDQIAWWVRDYCTMHGIPANCFFYDSTGRGSLGPALARNWSAQIQPVEFGGVATDRPVSMELKMRDPKTGMERLKLCRDFYSRFVTELWWTVRAAIESDQIRGMNDVLCTEGSSREWKETAGNKIEVETKREMKERIGHSPDYFDWLVTAVEGARRRGFIVSKLANESKSVKPTNGYLAKLASSQSSLLKAQQLDYS